MGTVEGKSIEKIGPEIGDTISLERRSLPEADPWAHVGFGESYVHQSKPKA